MLGCHNGNELRTQFPRFLFVLLEFHLYLFLSRTYFGALLSILLSQGNQGVLVLRRINEGRAEFLLVSLWESWDAIRAFAGDDLEKAMYYPEVQKFLLTLEPTVIHYEVPLPLE
jgi:hypothetical protein